MRSKKCIGFLILSALCVPLFLTSSDASALKHEYDGLPILNHLTPAPLYDSNDDNYYFDWHNEPEWWTSYGATGFDIHSTSDSLKGIQVREPYYYIRSQYNSSTNKCEVVSSGLYVNSIYSGSLDSSDSYIGTPINRFTGYSFQDINSQSASGQFFIPEYYEGNKMCWSRNGMSSIDESSYHVLQGLTNSFPNSYHSWNYLDNLISDKHIFPYNFMYDGISFVDSHKQSDGIVYTKRFSFGMLFNKPVLSFSSLTLGLDDYSGYWYNDNNLYKDRSIDFHFLFSFDESFTISQDFINRGHLQLRASTQYKHHENSQDGGSEYYNCTSTVRVVGDNEDYYWDISCPVTLDRDYIAWVPSLTMYFDDNPVNIIETTGDWSFSSVYIVTDHDSTPGRHFNDDFHGNTSFWNAYWSDNDNQYTGAPDWLQSLVNLFTFSFINPFAPIFQMFSDNNSCAQIPIIAGMLHSEETEVCPWFDSTTRNIVTPVLGLSAMMLVFGFAVRWLGSHSGNMFEDTGQHDFGTSSTLKSKYRRRKD